MNARSRTRLRTIASAVVLLLTFSALPALGAETRPGGAAPAAEQHADLIDPVAVQRLAEWREEHVTYRHDELPGQLLVTTAAPDALSWAGSAGLDAEQVTQTGSKVHMVQVEPGTEAEAIGSISAAPGVVAVERVHSGEFFEVPDDALYDQQWSHQQTDIEAACRAVFEARGKHVWPPALTAEDNWEIIYVRALEGLEDIGITGSLDEALVRVQSFIDRIAEARSR